MSTISGGNKCAAPSMLFVLSKLLNAVQTTFRLLLHVDDAGVNGRRILMKMV